jgi:hypothetical protein
MIEPFELDSETIPDDMIDHVYLSRIPSKQTPYRLNHLAKVHTVLYHSLGSTITLVIVPCGQGLASHYHKWRAEIPPLKH